MEITRRGFLAQGGIVTMTLTLRRGVSQTMSDPAAPKFRPQLKANTLVQFVDPLPLPDVASPSGHRPSPEKPTVQLPYYRMAMRQFETRAHRDLKPTRLWGFASTSPGPVFETRSGQGLLVEWVNDLPAAHFVPIDHSIHGAEAPSLCLPTMGLFAGSHVFPSG